MPGGMGGGMWEAWEVWVAWVVWECNSIIYNINFNIKNFIVYFS